MSSNDVEIKQALAKMGETTSGLKQDVKYLDAQIESLKRKVDYLSQELKRHQDDSAAHHHPTS